MMAPFEQAGWTRHNDLRKLDSSCPVDIGAAGENRASAVRRMTGVRIALAVIWRTRGARPGLPQLER
jgi:hypothetical protein